MFPPLKLKPRFWPGLLLWKRTMGLTEEEIHGLIRILWLEVKPSIEAQSIRARISTEFDSPEYQQWAADYVPDYVWDLVDIAAQRGIEYGWHEN